MYWHIRGKNLTAREYAAFFLDADIGGSPAVGRAGAQITAGLASWTFGQFDRANDEMGRGVPHCPRRAMYLLGHTDPTLTMRVYQQVIDMGEGGVQTLEHAIGCTIAEAFTLLSGRGVSGTQLAPERQKASQLGGRSELEGAETA